MHTYTQHNKHTQKQKFEIKSWVGEMVPMLRVCSVLEEDPSLVSSTHKHL